MTLMRASPLLFVLVMIELAAAFPANGLMPYGRSIWDMLQPTDDPYRILEQSPIPVPKAIATLALARADWRETPHAHVIFLDVPGVRKEDFKIEVEESRVLMISGERKSEEEYNEGKWHWAERIHAQFWRRIRLPANADVEDIKAHLENGVLRVTVPKVEEEKKRQPKLVHILEESEEIVELSFRA